jgi:hypothetical protein
MDFYKVCIEAWRASGGGQSDKWKAKLTELELLELGGVAEGDILGAGLALLMLVGGVHLYAPA